jgi:hypothetical protein
VTAHVRGRLSAYLDGELPPEERSAVEQHLRVCAPCAHRLEDLAALDDAARALTIDAPPGYFEDLPARVRARLDKPTRRAWRPPAWGWAVAAALLLAIVTPATLLQRETRPQAPATGRAGPEPTIPAQQAAVPRDDVAPTPVPERTTAPTVAYPAPAKRVSPNTDELDRLEDRPEELAKPRRREAPSAGPVRPAEPLEEARATEAKEEHEGRADAASAAAGAPQARDDAAKAFAAPPALAGSRAVAAQTCAASLLASPAPGSLAEARQRRAGWSDCARQAQDAAGADEARVRLVEAGAAVYRLSGDENDLRQTLVDAAAYLARSDALQPERVRAVLGELERRP